MNIIRFIRERLFRERKLKLIQVLPFEEIKVSLSAELFGEGDAGLLFGGGGDMTGTVGSGLDDMHHTASACRITADIERVCSHQNPAYRLYSGVKVYLSHKGIKN